MNTNLNTQLQRSILNRIHCQEKQPPQDIPRALSHHLRIAFVYRRSEDFGFRVKVSSL